MYACIIKRNEQLLSGLEEESQKVYELKLKVAGVSLQDDPYSLDRIGQWSTELVSWSKMEYEDILSYFISRPSTFTLQQLSSWIELKAYNYYKDNIDTASKQSGDFAIYSVV